MSITVEIQHLAYFSHKAIYTISCSSCKTMLCRVFFYERTNSLIVILYFPREIESNGLIFIDIVVLRNVAKPCIFKKYVDKISSKLNRKLELYPHIFLNI